MDSKFTSGSTESSVASKRNEEISSIRQKIEESQKRQRDLANIATGPQKSLYDILQENRAKKQAEFEEEYAQRNAIHRLDNDEIDYLEGLLKKEREKEAIVRNEVEQGLNQFKQKRQAEGDDLSKNIATKKVESVKAYVPATVVKRRKKNTGVVAASTQKKDIPASDKPKEKREDDKKEPSEPLPKPLAKPKVVGLLGAGYSDSDSD